MFSLGLINPLRYQSKINHKNPIIMTTIIKVLVASVLALLMTSCNFNFGVSGNGNVRTEERDVTETFSEIEVSNGLDVYLTQSDEESISVQSDGNLQDIIKTEIVGNVLKIYTKKSIRFSEAQKVMVNFKNVSKISASSGSDVFATNTFQTESIKLVTSSGSDMEIGLNAQTIECTSSSGSDLKLSGSTIHFKAQASSGSDINALNLQAETSRVKASSGADIRVNSSEELYANANSGGDIKYSGNPKTLEKINGPSGSINQE